MKKLLLAVVILAALVASGAIGTALLIASQGGYAKPLSISTAPVCTPDAGELLGYINAERSKLGAAPLGIDSHLAASSQHKLQDMVAGRYYGHNLLDGSEPWGFIRSEGIHASLSEDLDINALSATQDWSALKGSPAHYESLTDASYIRVGISTQCVSYPIEHSTGPDNNTNLVGTTAKELTVIHLATPEPAAPAPQVSAPVTRSRGVCTYYPAIETVPARSICN